MKPTKAVTIVYMVSSAHKCRVVACIPVFIYRYMMLKITVICCFILLVDVNAFVKRDAPAQPQTDFFANMQKNIDQFRHCVDQSLGNVVGQVNEKQLQPLLSVVGDTLNRVSKAFDDLTATTKPALQGGN